MAISDYRDSDALGLAGGPVTGVAMPFTDLGQCGTALPQETQFAAAYAQEALWFRLATQLEAAGPWAQHRPPGFEG